MARQFEDQVRQEADALVDIFVEGLTRSEVASIRLDGHAALAAACASWAGSVHPLIAEATGEATRSSRHPIVSSDELAALARRAFLIRHGKPCGWDGGAGSAASLAAWVEQEPPEAHENEDLECEEEEENLYECPLCESRRDCGHLVTYWDRTFAGACGLGCGPIEPAEPLGHETMAELSEAFEPLLVRILTIEDGESCEDLVESLGLPERLVDLIVEEAEEAALEEYEGEKYVATDSYVGLRAWSAYLEGVLKACGATQFTRFEDCVPLASSAYQACWSSESHTCVALAQQRIREDAAALREALAHPALHVFEKAISLRFGPGADGAALLFGDFEAELADWIAETGLGRWAGMFLDGVMLQYVIDVDDPEQMANAIGSWLIRTGRDGGAWIVGNEGGEIETIWPHG